MGNCDLSAVLNYSDTPDLIALLSRVCVVTVRGEGFRIISSSGMASYPLRMEWKERSGLTTQVLARRGLAKSQCLAFVRPSVSPDSRSPPPGRRARLEHHDSRGGGAAARPRPASLSVRRLSECNAVRGLNEGRNGRDGAETTISLSFKVDKAAVRSKLNERGQEGKGRRSAIIRVVRFFVCPFGHSKRGKRRGYARACTPAATAALKLKCEKHEIVTEVVSRGNGRDRECE